jgi:hypothetical protein
VGDLSHLEESAPKSRRGRAFLEAKVAVVGRVVLDGEDGGCKSHHSEAKTACISEMKHEGDEFVQVTSD